MKNMEIQDYTRREILNCSGEEKEKLRETWIVLVASKKCGESLRRTYMFNQDFCYSLFVYCMMYLSFWFPIISSIIPIFAKLCGVKLLQGIVISVKSRWVGMRAERLHSALQSHLWDRKVLRILSFSSQFPWFSTHLFFQIYFPEVILICPKSSSDELVSRFSLFFHISLALLMLFYLLINIHFSNSKSYSTSRPNLMLLSPAWINLSFFSTLIALGLAGI